MSTDQRRGDVFAPMHWTDEFAAAGPIGRAVAAVTDPISGQPELKVIPVRLFPVGVLWYGLLLRQSDRPPAGDCYWTRVPFTNGHAFDRLEPFDQRGSQRSMGGGVAGCAADGGARHLRRSRPRYLVLCEPALLGKVIELEPRTSLLAEASAVPGAVGDPGHMVCSCFAIGLDTLLKTIADHQLTTVAEVGDLLRAGTNCRSCIPEIRTMLRIAGKAA